MDSLLSGSVKASTLVLKEKSSSSDQDLPEPSVIRVKKQASPSSGSTNYDDSDMDHWAANLPSEILEFDVDAPALSTRKDRSDSGSPSVVSAIVKNNKRPMFKGNEPVEQKPKRPRTGLSYSVDEVSLVQDTPMRKRTLAEILPTPRSSSTTPVEQPKPLFRPSSSVGRPSPGTSNSLESKPKTPPREDAFEDFMDYIFDGVKIVTGGTSEDVNTMVKVQDTPEHNSVSQLSPEQKYASQRSPLRAVKQPIKVARVEHEASGSGAHDPMADFNSWLDENGL
ncbi:hypothetical protein RSAG8_10425, partial [Rhizoctonia solani AG-8 WAC10335]